MARKTSSSLIAIHFLRLGCWVNINVVKGLGGILVQLIGVIQRGLFSHSTCKQCDLGTRDTGSAMEQAASQGLLFTTGLIQISVGGGDEQLI